MGLTKELMLKGIVSWGGRTTIYPFTETGTEDILHELLAEGLIEEQPEVGGWPQYVVTKKGLDFVACLIIPDM